MAIPNDLQPHFVLFPFLAQGHMIPMVDIARLLARRGVTITILTTPLNAKRFEKVIARAVDSGLRIRVIEIQFPCVEAGLPEGCENFDKLTSITQAAQFFTAVGMLEPSVEEILGEMKPLPSCLISDMCYPWTTKLAAKFNIPRLVFHGMCCFGLLCLRIFWTSEYISNMSSMDEYFQVPGLPGSIMITKAQLAGSTKPTPEEWVAFRSQLQEAEDAASGVVVNTFEDLEAEYIREYRKVNGQKVWCIGPVSFCNEEQLDKAERGSLAAIDKDDCLKWLGSWEPNSVVYACLGSLSRLGSSQLIELGLGLESTNKPFIWVVREPPEDFKKWVEAENFEERIKPRGMLIHGWAPQVLILSHPSITAFLTHCGWNSTLEGISSGVPLITWPVFAEQFINEKLVVQVLNTGVRSGVEIPVLFGEEESMGVLVTKDEIKTAVEKVMDEGEDGETRRKRAKELGEMARRAVEEGGSSSLAIAELIQDITQELKSPKSVIQNHD